MFYLLFKISYMFVKKTFDKVKGEIRKCKMCELDFHAHHPVWFCPKCQVKKQQAIHQRKKDEGIIKLKDAYPFPETSGAKKKRFSQIRKKLNKCKTSAERSKVYGEQLEEIQKNGIWEWIFDRRDNESMQANKIKSKKLTNKQYPDLRGLQID